MSLAVAILLFANVDADECTPRDPVAPVSVAALEQRVAQQRAVLANNPDDETARNALTDVTIDAARAIEEVEANGLFGLIDDYAAFMDRQLVDTRWRTGYLARNGNTGAQLALALMHRNGILMEADDAKACELYAQAAAANDPLALFRHAVCLSESEQTRAVALIKTAAELGNVAAQLTYGMVCEKQPFESADCTRQWLCAAARGGRARAAGMAGWLYLSGHGAPLDQVKAVELLTFAAEREEAPAQNQLAKLIQSGRLGRPDPVAAATWFRRAAENGFAPAQYEYGLLLASGEGVAQSLTAARSWMQKAAEQGFDDARTWLDSNPAN